MFNLRNVNMSAVSWSTWMRGTSTSERSGTKSMRRSRSSSCSFNEMPRTGPFWMRRIRCVIKPATLLRIRLEGIWATSSATFLLKWKSKLSLA
uniref:Uncharacterized protein n=1 Tax=Babesia bovis TaxID=5865 RepID=S6CAS7_BABBO|nr:hypothetical protein [Babesia bovis]